MKLCIFKQRRCRHYFIIAKDVLPKWLVISTDFINAYVDCPKKNFLNLKPNKWKTRIEYAYAYCAVLKIYWQWLSKIFTNLPNRKG